MEKIAQHRGGKLPIVLHQAEAEISRIGQDTIGKASCRDAWMAKLLELCFSEWLHWLQWSPHPQLLDVVRCSAAVVVPVVLWGCSRCVIEVQ